MPGRQPERDVCKSAVAEQVEPANPHRLRPVRHDSCHQKAAHLVDQSGVVTVNCNLQNGIFGVSAEFMWQPAHQLADVGLQLLVQFSVCAGIFQHALKLTQRVLASTKGVVVEQRPRRDDDSLDPGQFLTESQSCTSRFGK